jgi:transcriptional regulator with XRE-family HTH domain
MAAGRRDPALGRRLAGARLQRGLSQGMVARRAKIAASYLSRIENGKIQPTLATVLRIAAGVGVPVEELLSGLGAGARRGGPCPVTAGGGCLLDLIRAEADLPAAAGEAYTPRQVRLLRRFTAWLRHVDPARLRAMELLLDDRLSEGPRGDGRGDARLHPRQPRPRR